METTQTIQEFINEGIKKFGASHFYKNLTDKDNYDVNSRKIFDLVVNDVRNKIKPNIISTIDDLAKLLDGNEYGEEYSNEYDINIETLCRDKNWVIIFPQSDDLLEVRGAINNEFDAWNGTFIEYCKANSFYLDDPDEETYKKAPENMFNVHVDNNEYIRELIKLKAMELDIPDKVLKHLFKNMIIGKTSKTEIEKIKKFDVNLIAESIP